MKALRLPKYADEFIAQNDSPFVQTIIRMFHRWLDGNDATVADLSIADVASFINRPARHGTRNAYRSIIRRYVEWLYQRKLLAFNSAPLRVLRREILPDVAEQFLAGLEPVFRPNTCTAYRNSLRLFHHWLSDNQIELTTFDRKHSEQWLRFLYDRHYKPMSRKNILAETRIYLRHLCELGLVATPGDELIRSSDFPKMQIYLPRPLPPQADAELRRRLAASDSELHQGLLLMRHTGLRISELQNLPLHCIHRDERGAACLRVPLGKLHSERLVPMDPATLAIAERLRLAGSPERTWLLTTLRGRRTRAEQYMTALAEISDGIELKEKLTSHRLRHTYATSLLNGGMSLISVMKILGHRDIRMTLRYTDIALETVGNEYFAALERIEKRYRIPLNQSPAAPLAPDDALEDIIRWINKRKADDPDARRRAQLLSDRLRKFRDEIRALERD